MDFTSSLKKKYQFKLVYNKGKSYANIKLVLYVLPNGKNINNLGLSVSKKVGKSVVRSRVSRLIRESYRLNEGNIKKGYNLVVIARVRSAGSTYHEIEKSLINLLKKSDLYV